MSKTKADRRSLPGAPDLDQEVVAFRRQFDERSPLDELIQEGARRMLQTAIDAEVDSRRRGASAVPARRVEGGGCGGGGAARERLTGRSRAP